MSPLELSSPPLIAVLLLRQKKLSGINYKDLNSHLLTSANEFHCLMNPAPFFASCFHHANTLQLVPAVNSYKF